MTGSVPGRPSQQAAVAAVAAVADMFGGAGPGVDVGAAAPLAALRVADVDTPPNPLENRGDVSIQPPGRDGALPS